MDYIWEIVGGIALLGLGVFAFASNKVTNSKVDDALRENKETDKKIEEDVKIIEHKEIGLATQEAQVVQKIESLEKQKVSEQDIADFINSLEKKDNK